MKDGEGECQYSRRKNQEEYSDLADDANDDRNIMAHIHVDSELKQLVGEHSGEG